MSFRFTITAILIPMAGLLGQPAPTGGSGPAGTPGAATAEGGEDQGDQARLRAASAAYVIRPGDIVQVRFYQEPDLDRERRVDADGRIDLPLVGFVEVAGKSVNEVRELIRNSFLGDYLVNPQVTITVVYYAERRVIVSGSVNREGEVMFPPEEEMTLLQALARAGGRTRLGSNVVTIRRINQEGETITFDVNISRIRSRADATDPVLQKGDIIFVPERTF